MNIGLVVIAWIMWMGAVVGIGNGGKSGDISGGDDNYENKVIEELIQDDWIVEYEDVLLYKGEDYKRLIDVLKNNKRKNDFSGTNGKY
jgi:hypothetical protein